MSQPSSRKSLLKNLGTAILVTSLVAGTLDGLAAIVSYLIKGGNKPDNIFKYIASAVFGKNAFAGGTPMILWGIFFHYVIALGLTLFYFWIYPKIKWLGQQPMIAGVLYGVFAWVMTTRVIIPLSRINQPPLDLSKAIIPILILVFFIGLPISLMTNKHYLYKK